MGAARIAVIRILVLATAVLGSSYVWWRWTESVNWTYWWIGLPLVVAETYNLVDGVLFGLTVWRLKRRGAAPPPDPRATADVFITTYNEDIDLVMTTARAAQAITWPHSTWILDDGAREEMRAAAEAEGIGYITRSDAIPDPAILDKTLGWFRDRHVALVQTPQWFTNVTDADPLGSQAPLFYGPIQQGKDGWNAAYFCGSNAVLRREALMELGITGYVEEVERNLRETLRRADRVLSRASRKVAAGDPVAVAIDAVRTAVADARRATDAGEPLSEVTFRFQRAVDAASRSVVAADVDQLQADLAAIAELAGDGPALEVDSAVVDQLAARDWSPLGALESVQAMVRAIDVDRGSEAQALMPLATISVTEDMATAMRIHAAGWKSVYHHEVLAHGLAPEDLGTMLTQRLRWAQGTLQVLLRENPLTKRGLSVGQRVMYFATLDPDIVERATWPDDDLAETGRGLVMARDNLDELRYERDGDANVWTLVRRRTDARS